MSALTYSPSTAAGETQTLVWKYPASTNCSGAYTATGSAAIVCVNGQLYQVEGAAGSEKVVKYSFPPAGDSGAFTTSNCNAVQWGAYSTGKVDYTAGSCITDGTDSWILSVPKTITAPTTDKVRVETTTTCPTSGTNAFEWVFFKCTTSAPFYRFQSNGTAIKYETQPNLTSPHPFVAGTSSAQPLTALLVRAGTLSTATLPQQLAPSPPLPSLLRPPSLCPLPRASC